jgi:hypothetical protein
MAQALHMANGDTLNVKLSAKDNRIDQLLADKASDQKIIEDVFLSALSRLPTATESKLLTAALAQNPADRRHEIEDLYWGVLSSNGFCFNH